MRGHAIKERTILGSTPGHAMRDETPDIVIVACHADFAWFVSGTKSFLVQQQGFFPKGAFGGENAGGKSRTHRQVWEDVSEIGLNWFFLMRPVVGASAEFDFHDGTHITSFGRGKDTGIVKQKALAVVHVG